MPEYQISILLTMIAASAIAPGERTVPRDRAERFYICESGAEFSIRFTNNHAIVFAGGQRYRLEPRRLSVGIRYGSDTVAFAQDGNRAVLIGAANGPYLNCIERPADPVA